ncbi:Rhomboid protease AarA [Moraxella caviae]|nr:rhomboid family intramembrane serine protease [Moraxella caviae]STZ10040.1 Rhomboid protease AarA [Moraxella caviae]VEW12769.1 Rhomboid protease AarA [Moraxella caviae]
MTLLFIVAFVGFAGYQAMAGVSLDAPSSQDLLRFGANFLPLSLVNEPWRIVSSAFLHIGVLHLLFNSFAMYYFGQVAEQIVGGVRFVALFLLAAIGGNLFNLFITWQDVLAGEQIGLSAGASGGIMGVGAWLLVLALVKARTPFMLNARGLALVMMLNLIMGFAVDGIDNAGHIGGAAMGVILGLAYAAELRTKSQGGALSWFWVAAAVLSLGFVWLWWVLQGWVLGIVG